MSCRHAGIQHNLHPSMYLLCYHEDTQEARENSELLDSDSDELGRWCSERLVDDLDVCDLYEIDPVFTGSFFENQNQS